MMIFPRLEWNIFSSWLRTWLSEGVYPGRSLLVLSREERQDPLLPKVGKPRSIR